MRVMRTEDGVEASHTFSSLQEGAPGIAHGGAVALAAHGFARWLTARQAAPFVRVDEPRQATPAPVPFR